MNKSAWKLSIVVMLLAGSAMAEEAAPPALESSVAPVVVPTIVPTTAPTTAPVAEPDPVEPAKPVAPAATVVPPAAEPAPLAAAMSTLELFVPIVDSGVIVYAEPKNKSAMVGLIESGAGVSATGEEQNGYLRIQGGSIIGWADKQLLKKSTAEQMMGEAKKFTNRVTRPRITITRMAKVEPIATDGRVVLYSASWCPYCDKARAYFQNNGVAFEEHDTEKSAKGRRDYEAMNGDGIPIVLVNNHKIVGWKQREFDRYYAGNAGAGEPQPAPVVQVARAVAAAPAPVAAPATAPVTARAPAPARIISSDAGPAYAPKVATGVIVYSQPTNKSPVGGLIKGSEQVIALGEEQNGYMRVQGSTGDGWVDKSLMKKL